MRRIGSLGDVVLVLLLLLAACVPFVRSPEGTGGADLEPSPEVASPEVTPSEVPPSGRIEMPASGARATLPLHILAYVGQPGDSVEATLQWQDGTSLTQTLGVVLEYGGEGLLVADLNWPGESEPPKLPTQPATLELRDGAGTLLARQQLTLLSPDDPDVVQVKLYFVLGETVEPMVRSIPRTGDIAAAALEELIWGPASPNLAGFGTALPTPQEVLTYLGREANWGPRVTLRSLAISDGVALADFSREMRAYGGGSLRVMLLRQQIERTLKQFPTVEAVVIAVEGETEAVLEP